MFCLKRCSLSFLTLAFFSASSLFCLRLFKGLEVVGVCHGDRILQAGKDFFYLAQPGDESNFVLIKND